MIRFLLKGLLRDRSRSLFPTLTVVMGVMLTVILFSWLTGAVSGVIESGANFSSGHVKVMSRAYAREAEQVPNDLAYIGVGRLLGELRRDFPELIWTPRIRFAGLLDIPDEKGETRSQGPVAGLAVDLLSPRSPEPKLLNLRTSLVRGRLPSSPGEILVSDELARRLGVGPDGTATLISATMNGAMVVRNFRVAGTLRFGVTAMDRGAVVGDIAGLQNALDMSDAAGEVLGFFRDFVYQNDAAVKVRDRFMAGRSGSGDDFAPVMLTLRDQGGLAQLLDFATLVYGVLGGLFVAVMSIVLWNAGLVASLRRYGEFGIRLAIGEDKGHLYRSLIAESLMTGLAGSLLGTALGLLASYELQARGLNIGPFMKNASIAVANVLRAKVTPLSYVVGFVPGLAATFIGKAVSGIGIYRRKTADLAKEFEA
jgi:putative ABC transport system permease protein